MSEDVNRLRELPPREAALRAFAEAAGDREKLEAALTEYRTALVTELVRGLRLSAALAEAFTSGEETEHVVGAYRDIAETMERNLLGGEEVPTPDTVWEWRSVLTLTDGRLSHGAWTTEDQARKAHAIDQEWFAEKDPQWCAAYTSSHLERRLVSEPQKAEEP